MEEQKAPVIRLKGFLDEWKQHDLSDIVDFLDTMRKPLKSEKREAGPYPYYGASGIVDYVKDYLFDEELILLSEDGANITDRNYPVCFLADGKYWVNNHAHVLKSKANIDNNFVCNSLERKDYTKYNSGMAMPKLNQDTCRNIPIVCPLFDEQKEIGDLLRVFDSVISFQRRKYEKLVVFKKSMLEKMFPQAGAKVPEVRFTGFSGDWELKKFNELYVPITQKNDLSFGTKQIISVANMYYNADASVTDIDYLRTYNVFLVGDIAFEGNKSKNFAHGRFVENTIGDGIVSHVFDVFRPIGQYDLRYWKYAINNENVMGPILVRCTKASTMMTNLVAKDFLDESICVPSIEEQRKIGKILSQLDESISLQYEQLQKLKKIKKALLDKMFV